MSAGKKTEWKTKNQKAWAKASGDNNYTIYSEKVYIIIVRKANLLQRFQSFTRKEKKYFKFLSEET